MSDPGRFHIPTLFARGLAAGGRQAELVPQARLSGPIPWVIAIMVALMSIAGAGGLALRNTASQAASELAGGLTVQIVEARPEQRAQQAEAALKLLQQVRGISDAQIVPQGELDALVEPWLGADSTAADGPQADGDVPIPALIDARLSGTLSAQRLGELQQLLRTVAPGARVDAQSSWLKPVFGAIASLQLLAAALIVLLSGATGAAVLLAARSALGANRDTIEIVHLLGGTDRQIARIFQRAIALDAAWGSVAGFAVGMAVVVLLGREFASLQAGIITGAALNLADWGLLLLVPIVAVAVAALTARLTAMRTLQRML